MGIVVIYSPFSHLCIDCIVAAPVFERIATRYRHPLDDDWTKSFLHQDVKDICNKEVLKHLLLQ